MGGEDLNMKSQLLALVVSMEKEYSSAVLLVFRRNLMYQMICYTQPSRNTSW